MVTVTKRPDTSGGDTTYTYTDFADLQAIIAGACGDATLANQVLILAAEATIQAVVDAILVDTGTTLPLEHTLIVTAIANLITRPKGLDLIFDEVDAVRAVTDALPVLTETDGTVVGAGGGEQNIVIENAPAGVFKPLRVKVSLENMLGGDTTVFRVYSRLTNGGALELDSYASYTGADGGLANGVKTITFDLTENRWGIRITLDETAAGTRNYDWQYIYEAV